MSSLFQDLEHVRAYIDDLLILTTDMWNEHLQQSNTVLSRLQKASLKINAKSLFWASQVLVSKILDHTYSQYPRKLKQSRI